MSMRRLFILLLILLLPLQVVAGAMEDRLALSSDMQQSESISASQPKPAPSTQSFQSPSGDWNVVQLDSTAANDNSDDQQAPSGDDTPEDLAAHAAFGDDAVPASFLVFAVQSPDFISTLHNDAASIPPYLPPAARPPKI